MAYSLTLFTSQYDNATDKTMKFDSWSDFVLLLRGLSQRKLKGKMEAPLISPAQYELGTTRANRNVVDWGHWCCVDVDDYEGDIDTILTRFEENDMVMYSTASSKEEQLKFRLVFNLDRRVQAEELRHFWFAINKYLGDLGDPQTKDSSRMYYIPAEYLNAYNFFHVTTGNPLQVDTLLRTYEYVAPSGNSFLDRLPEGMKDKVLQHRRDSMDNLDITWAGYGDCPFVNRRMVAEYKSIAGTGWYAFMYKLMTSIAANAVRSKYPISAQQIANLCREIDRETGGWYDNRPLEREAQSAISWAYANAYED